MKFIVFVFLAVSVCFAQQAKPTTQLENQQSGKKSNDLPLIPMSKEEAKQFWVWIANQGIDYVGGGEDFKNVSKKTKDRLQWIVDMEKRGLTAKLEFGRIQEEPVHYLMTSSYQGENPVLGVNLSWLAVLFLDKYNSKTPIDREGRNTLTIAFSHEAIHLKHGVLIMNALQSDPEVRAFEERRTWAQNVIEDIRPMLEKGEPMDENLIRADKLLRSCNDDMDCPAFKKFISDNLLVKNNQ